MNSGNLMSNKGFLTHKCKSHPIGTFQALEQWIPDKPKLQNQSVILEQFKMAEGNNDKLRIEFQQYDKNGDGFITKDELKEVLGKVQTLTDQDLEDLMKDVDVLSL